ncbi:MAG: hypothetical protein Kow00105_19660 [Phycisphaeraceae bacterium]
MRRGQGIVIWTALAVWLWGMTGPAHAAALLTYHVGNSLTEDAGVVDALPELVSDAGHSLITGYHIRCARSLDYILNNPTDVCIPPNAFGTFDQAFANHAWDAITLQPHTGGTLRQEYEAFKSMIQLARQNPNNADTPFFLYATWDARPEPGVSFYRNWYDPAPVDPDGTWTRKAESFKWVYRQLKSDPELAGVELKILPVGDVLAEVDRRLRSGEVVGFSGGHEFYRDELHLNRAGRFAVGNTFLSMLFGIDPTGVPTNRFYNTNNDSQQVTPEFAAVVQEVVWDVVNNPRFVSPLAGDVDGDGFVGIADLNAMLGGWNLNVPFFDMQADPTGDGFVGIDDLSVVLNIWNQTTLPGDLDQDGFVGIGDLTLVISHWNQSAPLADPRADPSGDGVVGIEDLNIVMGSWNQSLQGDLDNDGLVGIADLNTVLNAWNRSVLPDSPSLDLSRDGFVGIDDLNRLLSNWNQGQATGGATVPEPGTGLLSVMLLGLLARSRVKHVSRGKRVHNDA